MAFLLYKLQILFILCVITANGDDESLDNSSIDSLSSELIKSTLKESQKADNSLNDHANRLTDCENGNHDKECLEHTRMNNNMSIFNNKSRRYPFTVSIQRKGVHYTTGALLNKRWVLTSAAEFFNVRESIKFFRVRLGTVNCKKGGSLIPIKNLEIHPSYQYKSPSLDVALLHLAMPVEYSEAVKPISFSKIKGKVLSAKFLTTYWPRLIVKGHVLPPTAQERLKPNSMRVSTQKMIPWDWCRNLMSNLNQTLEGTSLCLDPIMSHHSPCLPDAGAPVTADDGLWGIQSGWTSERCLEQPSPTIVTRVSTPIVRTWLKSQIADV